MPVSGRYIARRVTYGMAPYIRSYCDFVVRNIMPVFNNLNERAEQVTQDEWNRMSALPATDDSGDGSHIAELAQRSGIAFYKVMTDLRQSSLNLYSAGLFHLIEQQLADLCEDATFIAPPPKKTNLPILRKWYRDHFRLDLASLAWWPVIEELRLVANTVKHGEINDAKKLRFFRPELFQKPTLLDVFEGFDFPPLRVGSPMAGESLFVTVEEFSRYASSVDGFILQMTAYFDDRAEQEFL